MTIDVYSICRNEAKILPYFLRHYETFARHIIVYDDDSDDGTKEMLDAHPKVHRLLLSQHRIDDEYFAAIFSTQPGSLSRDADWAICVDMDEFVYAPWLAGTLADAKAEGYDVIDTLGFQMVSDHFPTTDGQIYDEITEGVPDHMQSKPVIYRPGVKVRYGPGRHTVALNGYKRGELAIKLLHFRFLGWEYAEWRHSRNHNRLSEFNLRSGSGVHNTPGWSGIYSRRWYEAAMRDRMEVIGARA